MRNKDGKYYPMCGDLPVVFPMLEMSGNRAHYIERIMHVYNRTNNQPYLSKLNNGHSKQNTKIGWIQSTTRKHIIIANSGGY